VHLETAKWLTNKLKKDTNIPIIWGGIEPTLRPEEAIKYVDFICVGEGDEAIVELVDSLEQNKDITKIRNIWANISGKIYENPVRPLMQNLDDLPFADFSSINKFNITNDILTPLEAFNPCDTGDRYHILTTRGCPYACSYCCNGIFHQMYRGQKTIRRRSPQNVMDELRQAKANYSLKDLWIWDEIFAFGNEWLREFLTMYKEEIHLPFYFFGHFRLPDKDVLQLMLEAGTVEFRLGIQSGSPRILKDIYNRYTKTEDIQKAAQTLSELGFTYCFDIISNCPFETEEDCNQTLDLLLSLPKPLKITGDLINYLTLFPKYSITKRVEEENIKPVLDKKTFHFYNSLYLLAQYRDNKTINILRNNKMLKNHSDWLKYFFPGQAPKFIQFLQIIIPQSIRDKLKNLIGKI